MSPTVSTHWWCDGCSISGDSCIFPQPDSEGYTLLGGIDLDSVLDAGGFPDIFATLPGEDTILEEPVQKENEEDLQVPDWVYLLTDAQVDEFFGIHHEADLQEWNWILPQANGGIEGLVPAEHGEDLPELNPTISQPNAELENPAPIRQEADLPEPNTTLPEPAPLPQPRLTSVRKRKRGSSPPQEEEDDKDLPAKKYPKRGVRAAQIGWTTPEMALAGTIMERAVQRRDALGLKHSEKMYGDAAEELTNLGYPRDRREAKGKKLVYLGNQRKEPDKEVETEDRFEVEVEDEDEGTKIVEKFDLYLLLICVRICITTTMEVSIAPGPIGLYIDDMDIDIDLGPDYTEHAQTEFPLITSSETVEQAPESIHTSMSITSEPTILHKVHIRGVDDLTTNDIRSFSSEHFTSHLPSHIEWIDDTSANIVYESPDIAVDALHHFTLQSAGDTASFNTLQLRSAKSLSTHPNSVLQVRIAISTDQKRPRAYEASRFYMMHPEHDPRERRRRNSRSDGDYHRRRYGNHEHRRRRKDDLVGGFAASMYDDDAGALAARTERPDRRSSGSSFSSGTGSAGFRGGSYRPMDRDHKRRRERSASPGKETDGRDRIRQRTPPPRYYPRNSKLHSREENATKELFPSKLDSHDIGSELRGTSKPKELFPTKKVSTNTKKELFPLKAGICVHRRSDAFDAADETADLFASGMSVPFVDGAMDYPSEHGRLKQSDRDPVAEDLADVQRGGFSIRGIAKQANQGFSIRGKATDGGSSAKELFPGKAGNAGKELFAEKLQGRGTLRRTAADMFY